jgi:intracellular septation protein
MQPILGLWWSLFWRLILFLALLWFAVSVIVLRVLFKTDDVAFIFWRPTAACFAIAVLLWFLAAASPRLLGSILWGDRLGLTPTLWRTIGQVLAVLFVALGTLNLIFWKLTSTETWLYFKLFAPLPLLAIALAVVCIALRNTHRVP